jgi:hypothetical protein
MNTTETIPALPAWASHPTFLALLRVVELGGDTFGAVTWLIDEAEAPLPELLTWFGWPTVGVRKPMRLEVVYGRVLWAWLRWTGKTAELFPDPWRARLNRTEMRRWKECVLDRVAGVVVQRTIDKLIQERQPAIVVNVERNPYPQASEQRREGLLARLTRGVRRLISFS